MKKFSLSLMVLLILPTCTILSQEFPIPADGAQWNNAETYIEDISNSHNAERIEVQGDTVFDGTVFSKLYRTWEASYFQVGNCEFVYNSGPTRVNEYVGAIRTNNNKKVLYIAPEDTIIRTLYDFSLNIGDTVYINGMNYQYTAEVTGIDSININGIYRRRLSTIGYMYDVWIEGIGSIYGLFASINRHWEKYGYELTCYVENGTPLYQQSPDSECYRCNLVSNVSDFQTIPIISVYPNPVVDISKIEYPSYLDPIQVNIYGVRGRLIYSIPLSSNKEVLIERQTLKTGVFLLELVDQNGKSHFHKILAL